MKNKLREWRIPLLSFAFLSVGAMLSWQHYFNAAFHIYEGVWVGLFVFSALFLSLLLIINMREYGDELRALDASKRESEHLNRNLKKQLDQMESQVEEWVLQSTSLLAMTDVHMVSEKVMSMLEKTLDADQGSIMLLDKKGFLTVEASCGIPHEIASKIHLQLGERIAGVAADEKREFLIVGDFAKYPLFHDLEENPIIKSAIICPIVYQEEVLGVLNVSRTMHEVAFTSEDLRKAKNFARHIGIAIHHASMCEKLERKGRELKNMYRLLKDSHNEMVQDEDQLPTPDYKRKLAS